MEEFEKGMTTLRNELREEMRKRSKELFDDFYPQLTDEDIEQALELSGKHFDDVDVEAIQAFYHHRSYRKAVEETDITGVGGIRMRVMRAIAALPEESPLYTALYMAYRHLDVAGAAWQGGE